MHLNRNTLHNTKNKDTMISPARQLPAASNLKMSAIAVRRMIAHDLRNTEMIFLNVKLIIPCCGSGGGLGGGGGGGG
jgi:hypothetical protein